MSSSSTPSRSRSSGSVVSFHQRVIASLLSGAHTRATIVATMMLRSRQGLAEIILSRPRCFTVRSTRSTCPWVRVRCLSSACESAISFTPDNAIRSASILSWGQSERLASVRFLTFLPSRHPSRSKTAGREFRLGTVSMYMGTIYTSNLSKFDQYLHTYMGTYFDPKWIISPVLPPTYPGFLANCGGNFCLEM